MISIRNILLGCIVVAVAAMLPGCRQTLPSIQSATFTYWKNGKAEVSEQQLTPEQISKLSDWLQNHSWGWHPVIATYGPQAVIRVSHADGSVTAVNVMGSVIVAGQKQRDLSKTERQEIYSILGVNHSAEKSWTGVRGHGQSLHPHGLQYALPMPGSPVHGSLCNLPHASAADIPHRVAAERAAIGA